MEIDSIGEIPGIDITEDIEFLRLINEFIHNKTIGDQDCPLQYENSTGERGF